MTPYNEMHNAEVRLKINKRNPDQKGTKFVTYIMDRATKKTICSHTKGMQQGV